MVVRVRVEPVSRQDIGRVVEVVESLSEWFTAGAVEGVVRDAKRMSGFVARVDGVVRGSSCLMRGSAVWRLPG